MSATIVLVKDTGPEATDCTRDFCGALINGLRDHGLEQTVQVVRAADLGIYNRGVVVKILPHSIMYVNVTQKDIERIVQVTLKQRTILNDLLLPVNQGQVRIVLRNCGVIDPESIDDYRRHGGYSAIAKCLQELSPQKVVDLFKASGLRGRGGAGFPLWMKWNLGRIAMGDQKYVICNGDEGDPGAYMDRSVLEGDPHSVIEGMLIGGYTIGASKGFLYIRAEYPLAISRVQKALDQAYERGVLGGSVLGTSFSFDLEIRLGAGAFVCGEETALIASIEGMRGTPGPRPPYPTDVGLWGKPTVINNVESLANVPIIVTKGAQWFSSIGTESSKGTKVFALTGKVRNSGLVEIPMGTALRDVVFSIGGGVLAGKKILAIQTGGPSGGVIPEKHFDTPVSYEHLQKLGSIMGSGGMIVMDEDDCLVDIAKFYLGFCVEESCGKCAPCRIGGYQMLGILDKITEGKGTEEDLAVLQRIAQAMQKASLCGLGQTAPNPILSTLNYFEQEYKEHIIDKKCRAGRCVKLFQFEITPQTCKRCRLCVVKCPVAAITGDRDHGYVINQDLCIKCGQCFEVCKFQAITRR